MPKNPIDDLMVGKPLSKLVLLETNLGTAPTIATSGTITHNHDPMVRVTTGGNITGVILQKGQEHGQTLRILNTSANTIVFAAVATSNVLDGANITIPATRMCVLSWDAVGGSWVAQEGTS